MDSSFVAMAGDGAGEVDGCSVLEGSILSLGYDDGGRGGSEEAKGEAKNEI